MKKKLFAILFALLLIISIPVCSHAEFGEFAGDSDYGNDSGGYDFDSDDDYDYGYDDDDDDDNYADNKQEVKTTYYAYVSGSHNGDDSSDGYFDSNGKPLTITPITNEDDNEADYSAVLGAMVLGVIIIIAVAVTRSKRGVSAPVRTYQQYNPVNPGADQTPINTLHTMDSYVSYDPEFSETELKEKISNIYIQMQNCWQNKNLEQLRPYFTDSLYAQYDRQLEPYRKNHQTNMVERIAVLGTVLNGWRKVGDNDEIIATVRTRIVDYVVEDKTQNVIRGDKNKEKFMTYEWTLARKSGVKTTSESGTRVVYCPNCGAPIDINNSAKCEYCDTIVTVDSSDWVINEIKGIAQRTR